MNVHTQPSIDPLYLLKISLSDKRHVSSLFCHTFAHMLFLVIFFINFFILELYILTHSTLPSAHGIAISTPVNTCRSGQYKIEASNNP